MGYVVRYGRMRILGACSAAPGEEHARGQRVVVRSDRGLEMGEVLCLLTDRAAKALGRREPGEIVRAADGPDLQHERTLPSLEKLAFATCHELIARRKLQMNLVDVEILFGRERIIFYYLAEKRVDFRELVRDLARALRTRIEMRQIGVRDEAKLLADYGDCGKPVCCNTHLSQMPPVSMKMAKLQKTTLDPSKISGRCGRLKCCLRYEYDAYREAEQELPPNGSRVETVKGRGRVMAQDVLARKLVVEYEDGRRIIIGVADVLSVEPRPRGARRPGAASPEFEADEAIDADDSGDDLGPGEAE